MSIFRLCIFQIGLEKTWYNEIANAGTKFTVCITMMYGLMSGSYVSLLGRIGELVCTETLVQ